MPFLSAACTYSSLVWLGEQGKTVLEYSNKLLGIPANLGNPLPELANYLCLQERVGLAFSAVVVGSVLSSASVLLVAKHSLVVLTAATVPAGLYMLGRRFF